MWNRIINVFDWFGELGERVRVVRDFNRAAKSAFIGGQAPTLLQAKTTKGNYKYWSCYICQDTKLRVN